MDIRRRARSYANIPSGEPINVENYLTIVALEDGLTAKLSLNACEYCIDGDGKWRKLSAGTETKSINTGQTLSFRGELTPNSSNGVGTFTISKRCNLTGNCASMIYGDEAADKGFTLNGKEGAFAKLFSECPVVEVSDDFLPSKYLYHSCYLQMFYNCKQLIKAPKLSATSLGYYCYQAMFRGCTSLVKAPDLPATSLESGCYRTMFTGCSALSSMPTLPANKLKSNCYNGMFTNCTSLKVATNALSATTLADYCYQEMFNGCTNISTAPTLPATTLAQDCYSAMFANCTYLTTAPELPATTLAERCYYRMFDSCRNLGRAPRLPATTLVTGCYNRMFYHCYGLNYINAQFVTTPSTTYTDGWVSGVASTGTFVKNANATWNVTGVDGVPEGWTVINE